MFKSPFPVFLMFATSSAFGASVPAFTFITHTVQGQNILELNGTAAVELTKRLPNRVQSNGFGVQTKGEIICSQEEPDNAQCWVVLKN